MKNLPNIRGERIERNTLIKERVPDVARKIEYEIGDIKQDDFIPQFKTKHWDNEANLSVRLKEEDYEADEIKAENGRIEWKKGIKTARLYELDGFEDGGFEFEVEFSENPDGNVIEYTLLSKEFDFFYQGELTEKEKEEGAERPENVIGSYAVYHKSKRNNRVGGKHYRTGKAFHIYRPFAEDANGGRVWCDLNIENDLMTVTVPQDFLDKAVYPVRVDPTFGYTSIGGTNGGLAVNTIRLATYSPGESGTVEKITIRASSNSPGTNFRGVVYQASDDSLVTYGSEVFLLNTSHNWIDLDVSDTSITNQDYGIGFWIGSGGSPTPIVRYDTGTNSLRRDDYTYHPTDPPANPFVEASSLSSRNYSIYATYTAASSEFTPSPMMYMMAQSGGLM